MIITVVTGEGTSPWPALQALWSLSFAVTVLVTAGNQSQSWVSPSHPFSIEPLIRDWSVRQS